jgi:predicted ATPase
MKNPTLYPTAPSHHRCRIAVTGGPGGGKTTAVDLFRREIGEGVVVVPEAATMMFMGGFPRYPEREAVRSAQLAIYHVQRNLEDIQAARYPERILICDRGTIDGAAYWPEDTGDFFESLETNLEAELARYDGVIFFESAAVGGLGIEGGNPARRETLAEAVVLDTKLRSYWSQHENFVVVHHNESFFKKISYGLAILDEMVLALRKRGLAEED